MRFKTLMLKNYGPFQGEVVFDLYKRGLVLVRGDNRDETRMNSNGSGKSSLVESMDWCLFGQVPRSDVVESIVHAGARECAVAVTAEDDEGNNVRVVRLRADGKQSLRLFYNDEDVTSLDARETQRHIEWHIGLDRQVFHSTVLFAQSEMFCFADSTDADRMSILTKILRMEEIDAWAVAAKDLKDNARATAADAREHLTRINTQIFMLEGMNPEKEGKAWAQQHAEAGERLRAEQAQLSAREAALPPMPQTRLALAEDTPLGQCRAEAERVEQLLQQAHGIVGTRCAEVARLGRLVDIGPLCPTCEQTVPAELAENRVAKQQQAEAQLREATAIVEKMAVQVREARSELRTLELRIAEHEARQVAERDHALWARRDLETEFAAYHRRWHEHSVQTNPFEQQRRDLEQKLQTLRAEQVQARQTLKEAEAALADFEWWVNAFGQRGLKSYILDARLAEMNDAANHWVKMLTGGSIWVRMENTTTLKSGVSRNKFNIRVFRQETDGIITERNYRSWSGGERRRISLGIDFGLSRLVAQRANKPWSLMVLDEVFRHLDAAGRDAAMQLLQHLREEKETVLVVDHDAEFQSMFEQTITVRKTNGCAVLLEGEQADEPSAEPVPSRANAAGEGRTVIAKEGDRPHRRRQPRRPNPDKRA